jgi:putative ABC transport system permease protein
MNIFESTKIALRGLSNNKMRTALTMLGIIIGVAVVIIVVAIGQGASQRVQDQMSALGPNVLTIFPGAARLRANAVSVAGASNTVTNGSTATGTQPGQVTSGVTTTTANSNLSTNHLTLDDSKLIAQLFTQTVEAVAPTVRGNVQIRYEASDSTTNLTGSTVDYPYVNNFEVDKGRFFTADEADGRQKVCVIGVTIADKLTDNPDTNLVGQAISINGQKFNVVGILTPKGTGAFGQDQDDIIIVPISTAMLRIFNKSHIDALSIRCKNPKTMPLAQEQISNFLRSRHHLQPPFPDNDDFVIRNPTEFIARQESVTNTMTSMLSIVAVVSLIVGGIGIMNIMLVSVTERTREIGIRKAIGATPNDILMQFLIESGIISLLGGLLGIALGVTGATLLAKLGGWNTIVSSTAVVAALAVSAGIGIFFGIYPASKAAQLHPIQALRYE